MNDNDYRLFNGRGKMTEDSYNFPIYEPDDFFGDLFSRRDYEENAGILLINENEYVLSFTRGDGVGNHAPAFARAYKNMLDGHSNNPIKDSREDILYSSEAKKKCISARIIYECHGDIFKILPDGNRCYTANDGYINFDIPDNLIITEKMFNQFMKFYDKYNSIIESEIIRIRKRKWGSNSSLLENISNNHMEFCVSINGKNKSDNLDLVCEILNSKMINQIIDNEEIDNSYEKNYITK